MAYTPPPTPPEKARSSVVLPNWLWKKLKDHAKDNGLTLNALIEDALRHAVADLDALKESKKGKR